jgi:ComF family protein
MADSASHVDQVAAGRPRNRPAGWPNACSAAAPVLGVAANAIVRVLLGPSCAVCSVGLEQPFDGPICAICRLNVPKLTAPLCVICGEPLASHVVAGPLCRRCEAHRPRYELARSVGRYDGVLREMIHAFKYGRRRALAEPLAAWLVEAGADVLTGADAVVPVPLHPLRALERGFNQADDLARLLGRPVWRVLRRVRRGHPQAGLRARERQRNVRRAFGLRPRWLQVAGRPFGAPRLQNAAVVLIDDVMTTGATLDACSRVLVDAGVRRVTALTVARSASTRHARPPRPPRPSTAPHR